jgi:hypothetical protein
MSHNLLNTTYDLSSDITNTNTVPLFYIPYVTSDVENSTRIYTSSLPAAYTGYASSDDFTKRYQGWSLSMYEAAKYAMNTTLLRRASTLPIFDDFIESLPFGNGNVSMSQGQIANTTIAIGYPPGHNATSYPSFTASVIALGLSRTDFLINVTQPPSSSPAVFWVSRRLNRFQHSCYSTKREHGKRSVQQFT